MADHSDNESRSSYGSVSDINECQENRVEFLEGGAVSYGSQENRIESLENRVEEKSEEQNEIIQKMIALEGEVETCKRENTVIRGMLQHMSISWEKENVELRKTMK